MADEALKQCNYGNHRVPASVWSSNRSRCRACDAEYARRRRLLAKVARRPDPIATVVGDFLRACAVGGGDGNAPVSVGVACG